MSTPHPVVLVIPVTCLALAGCGPSSPTASRAASTGAPSMGTALEQGSGSDATRAAFAAAGIDLPGLGVVLRRRGVEILGFRVRSEDAVATWERLRAHTGQTGMYPLIVRDEHGNLLAEQGDFVAAPADILAAAARIDPEAWLKKRALDTFGEAVAEPYPREPGAVPAPHDRFTVPFDIVTGKGLDDVFIVLLPTTEGAQAPAWMLFGGWNECPAPEEHVAMLRRWHQKYGAEPVTMSGDVMELRVTRTVRPAATALELAKEQYVYCSDIVDQGVESVDALAAALMHSSIWFFWWD